jgi:hypothetical protein
MTRRRMFLALCLAGALTEQTRAQVIFVPSPVAVPVPVVVPAPVLVVPGGIGISYHRRHFSGFYGSFYPYGAVDNRVTVNVIAPTVVSGPRPLFGQQGVDLRGVDLDVVGPEALQPGARREVARIPAQPAVKKPIEKVEVAKQVEQPAKRPVVEVPKKEAPAPPKPAPPKPPAAEKLPPPKLPPQAEPLHENRRLVGLGLMAFQAGEYGLAALRFRQAAEVEPAQARPYFLLAQAYLALGKYKDAVVAVENGMKRQEDWPLSAFQPRVDLYKGMEDEWFAHKKQLAEVQALHPNQPAYLFLQAYQWWFDGQRDQAAEMFERAKVLTPNNPFIGAFLKVIPKVATK